MKVRIAFQSLALLLILAGCMQSEAEKTAQLIKETTEANTPAAETPSENGIYLKVIIDGKLWQAEKMIPDMDPNSSYKRIHGEKGEIMISFQLWKPQTGMKREFKEDYAADFFSEDGIFGGRKGEVIVTKADDQFIEGTFYFTATTTANNSKHEITNGSFRVAATPPANQ
jgi:Tfp pilus assembly protein PilP